MVRQLKDCGSLHTVSHCTNGFQGDTTRLPQRCHFEHNAATTLGVRSTCSARDAPRRTSGDNLPAARSPSIWWKWLQKRTEVTVMPTTTDTAHTASGTGKPTFTPLTCGKKEATTR